MFRFARYWVPLAIGLLVALADLGNADLLFAGTLLLVGGFAVGWYWPRQWWLGGLLLGGVLPLVQLWAVAVQFPMPYVPDPVRGSFFLIPAVLMAGVGALVHERTPYTRAALKARMRRARQADEHEAGQ